MSISDEIVVMKLGVVQQQGAPQQVYNDPANLFVANFLGTPPINVFEGKVSDGGIYIGNERIMEANGVADQEVYVGIRPEGFILADAGTGDNEKGVFTCDEPVVETMGGALSIVSKHSASQKPSIRSTVTDDCVIPAGATNVKFRIKPNKLYIFNKETEERIRF